MHGFASFNLELIDASVEALPLPSPAVLHGRGVFTTLAVYDSKPFLWEKHWARLTRDSQLVGIDMSSFPESDVASALDELVRRNDVSNGRARITLVDESSSTMWPYRSHRDTSLSILTGDFRQTVTDFALGVSRFLVDEISPLAPVKTCSYLEKFAALDDVRREKFDEAIRLNHRHEVTAACMANIFWVQGGKLFTPPLSTGCLPGTTREHVLENLDCEERLAGIEELRSADDIFLTSSGIGVGQVARFEARRLKMKPHPIMRLLPRRR